jgi:MoxR-like ATPase
MTTVPSPSSLERFSAGSALDLGESVAAESELLHTLVDEVGRVISGQRRLLERVVLGLLADGHVLLEGLPGLAKTLTVRTLARTIAGDCARIQFTPDLLPSDLTGTQIYHQGTGEFTVQRGPVFTNILLADEINRAPAKVQSALLEAMQERQVTIGGESLPLPPLFLVLATQNPIEQEGTYPLPEAQIDRFMFKLIVTYPERHAERAMLDRMTDGEEPVAEPVLDPARLLEMRLLAHRLFADARIKEYVLDLIAATRDPAAAGLADLAPMLQYGASPRAAIYLLRAAKAEAFFQGRSYVLPDDVKAIAPDVLRHRLIPTYRADAEGITPDAMLERILATVPAP